MKHPDKNDPKLEELSPQYDHYVDQALDYARGHLLPEDAAAFRDRMKSDEMFRRVVSPVLDAHDGPRSSPAVIRAGWADLRNRIVAAGGTPPSAEAIEHALAERTTYEQRVKERSRGNWRLIRRIAAVFAFLLLVPVGLIVYLEIFHIAHISTPPHVSSVVRLPDGSVVRLEPASSLRYAKSFATRRERWIGLEGEAEFTVTRTEGHFRVETDNAIVRVTGTRFIVRADESFTLVAVNEGTVTVQALDAMGEAVGLARTLKAGDRVRVTKGAILNEPVAPNAGGTP